MRAKDDLTYQEYKEGVEDAFHLMGRKGWETADKITDYMADEDNDLLVGTSLALWMISIGAYEAEHDCLEPRVREQLRYDIRAFLAGEYDDDLTQEDIELMRRDVELILARVDFTNREGEEGFYPDENFD